MIMDRKENLITGIVSIILGFLFIIMKGGVISVAITVFGIAALISAVIDFKNGITNIGIIEAVVGICVLIFGWMFVNLALYILAAMMIVMGLLQIVNIKLPVNLSVEQRILAYARPLAMVIAGACLLFNQGGTIAWVFIVAGILLIADGVLELINIFK